MSFVRLNKKVGKPSASTTRSQSTQQNPPKGGGGTSLSQPIQVSRDVRAHQKILEHASVKASITIPNGCKPWVANQLLTSTGVRDLDALVGGGMPLGSITLVNADARTKYHSVFTKTFLRYGYTRHQRIILISGETIPQSVYTLNQCTRASSLSSSSTPIPTTSNTKSTKRVSQSIDDDEEQFSIPSSQQQEQEQEQQQKPTRLTQGAMQSALHDGKSKELTIAWQYNKYKRSVDDNNLRGTDDMDLDDPALDDHDEPDSSDRIEDELGITNQHSTVSPSSSSSLTTQGATPRYQQQLQSLNDTKDTHLIPVHFTPHTTLSSQLDDVIRQLQQVIQKPLCKPRSIHSTTPSDDQTNPTIHGNDDDDAKHEIVPNRIVIDIFSHIMSYYTMINSYNPFNLSSSPSPSPSPSPSTTQVKNQPESITGVITRFIHQIRAICSTTPTLVTIILSPTLPNIIYNTLIPLSHLSFSLNPFSSSIKPSPSSIIYSAFDGLLTIQKLPRLNTLDYTFRPSDTLLFLFKEKRSVGFTITKLALPPEVSRTGTHQAQVKQQHHVFDGLVQEAINEITKATAAVNLHDQQTAKEQSVQSSSPSSSTTTTSPASPLGSKINELNKTMTTPTPQSFQPRLGDVIVEEGEEDEDEE